MTASYSILQAGKGTRTLDLLITNQLRYRLRYSSISLQQKLLYLLMDNFASKKMKYSHNLQSALLFRPVTCTSICGYGIVMPASSNAYLICSVIRHLHSQ